MDGVTRTKETSSGKQTTSTPAASDTMDGVTPTEETATYSSGGEQSVCKDSPSAQLLQETLNLNYPALDDD